MKRQLKVSLQSICLFVNSQFAKFTIKRVTGKVMCQLPGLPTNNGAIIKHPSDSEVQRNRVKILLKCWCWCRSGWGRHSWGHSLSSQTRRDGWKPHKSKWAVCTEAGGRQWGLEAREDHEWEKKGKISLWSLTYRSLCLSLCCILYLKTACIFSDPINFHSSLKTAQRSLPVICHCFRLG